MFAGEATDIADEAKVVAEQVLELRLLKKKALLALYVDVGRASAAVAMQKQAVSRSPSRSIMRRQPR